MRSAVALYVMDVDGSRLHLLASSGHEDFPAEIHAPHGIGPEVPLELLPALAAAVSATLPGCGSAPLILSDRALGVLVTRGAHAELEAMAGEAALAIELASGYTDVIHAARRRRRPQAAAEIQQNLLPPRLARVTSATLAGGVLPGYEVGGDFFDYADDAEGLWLTVADAVGKGDEAAALASLAIGALRSARRSGANVEEACRAMHEAVRSGGGGSAFVTAVCALWNLEAGTLRWITAGHPRPILVDPDGRVVTLEGGVTRPLGVDGHGAAGRAAERVVPAGARLVLYSDGMVEQPVADDARPFGVERLTELVRDGRGTTPAGLVRALQDAVLTAAGETLRDDVTVLVVGADPPGAPGP